MAIGASLSPRQLAILADVHRLGVASGDQLQRLHYNGTDAGKRMARLDLARLHELQVLERLDRRIGGKRAGSRGHLFALGTAGQRIALPNMRRYRPPWTPGAAVVRHALAVSELYVGLLTIAGNRLVSYDTEPRCWRRYYGPGGAPAVLKPDAFAVLELGEFEDRYFIEVDRGTESGPRITEKAKAYVRYWQSGREQEAESVFPWVIWVTTTVQRRALLIDALTRLPAEHWQLFLVTTMSAAAEAMAAGPAGATSDLKEVKQ